MSAAIAVPHTPLRELGLMPRNFSAPLYPASVRVPKVPLHLLGMGAAPVGPTVTSMAAPIAGAVTSSIVAGTAAGSWAGPIGAAVGAVIGIVAGLWAAHDARAAGAKSENAALQSAVDAFDASIKVIFQSGLAPADAVNAVQQNLALYWQHMAPYQSGPGRSDSSHGGSNCPVKPNWSSKSCTAGCSIGCWVLTQDTQRAIQAIQTAGTFTVGPLKADKYGFTGRSGYSVTYTPPTAAQSVSSELSALTGGSGGSVLPLLLVGLAAFLVLR